MSTRDEYLSPGDPGYDRQVLRVSRQLTFTTIVPITSYPDMTVPESVEYERGLGLPEIIESLQFLDETKPGQSLEMRTHVEVRHQAPMGESTE